MCEGVAALLVERLLRAPVQTREIGVFAILGRRPGGFFSFALRAPLFFLPLFHHAGLLAVALRQCGFAWSSDDDLLWVSLGSVTPSRRAAVCGLPAWHPAQPGRTCFRRATVCPIRIPGWPTN